MPYYPSYQQFYPQYQQPAQQQSSLIHVQSETQAREWSIAPGTSLMFIDDNQPFIYTKTAGNSQLEPCVFKIFRVSEIGAESASKSPAPADSIDILPDSVKAEIEAIRAELGDIKADIENLKKKRPKKELMEHESAE